MPLNMYPRPVRITAIAISFLFLSVDFVAAETDGVSTIDNICLAEARRAEDQHGIPRGVLQSITRVEAGRKTVTGEYMPWPWTLNDKGEGLFFDTKQAAVDYLQAAVSADDHSVDAGCMQVNTKWHMDGFFELADMLDPVQNADYAASFLIDLHAAHQSWDGAVKHYHSSDPAKHVQYHARVLAELETYLAAHNTPLETTDPVVELADTPMAVNAASAGAEPEYGSAEYAPDLAIGAPSGDRPNNSAAVVPASDEPASDGSTGDIAVAVSDTVIDVPTQEDADRLLRERQPHLAPQWQKVEQFRAMLAREAS
ncbi:MAG: hypothetical protein ACON4I_09225 [Candidatus Puniceispirillaceae bacterium]